MQPLTRIATVTTLSTILFATAGPTTARQWTTTPTALATDYAQIIDSRSNREVVALIWLTPEMIKAEPKNELARDVLKKYIVIGTAHAKISTMGKFTFLNPKEVVLRIKGVGKRRPLDPNSIPPSVIGVVTAMQRVFSQAFGKLGKGMHWVTFVGDGIDSCGPGLFWVDFAGEHYDYRTPIPGCT